MMMKKLYTLLFVFCSVMGFSQYQNVKISDLNQPEEPSISMDFSNPDRLVAGANVNKYYYSDDGGLSWEAGILTSPGYVVWGDPCIINDTAGDFYFLHLSYQQGGPWIDRIYCQKYDFENDDWSDGSFMGKNGNKAQDKEWAVVDSSNNNIYVSWTQFDDYGSENPNDSSIILFSKSTDAGLTWASPIRLSKTAGDCIDSDNTTEGAVPTMGPNGEIYVAWAGPLGIMFDKSLDQGQTWMEDDVFVNAMPTGWDYNIPGLNRCNGLPITSCDISGGMYNGTIYINWSDQRNGEDDTDIWLAKSTDGGNTWSDAIRVNDDAPGKQQFMSWMTVDQVTGEVLVVFYDRRDHDGVGTDVYLARSNDGGETFNNIKISEEPFYPSTSAFFGDYTNIVANNGIIRPIWTRGDGGALSIYTAIIDNTVGVNDFVEMKPGSILRNYPNPFKESTTISFKIKAESDISLSVIDVYGREVVKLIENKNYMPGKYSENFYPEQYGLKSGVYYFMLVYGNNMIKEKMVLVD